MGDRDTLSEIKQMLQQKQDIIGTSVHVTQSLRSENPTIRVAKSIYEAEGHAGSILIPDTASVVAPSELEFDFDNMIINSQAYRRVLAQAHAKSSIEIEEDLGDLIYFTDEATVKHEDQSTGNLSVTFNDLEGLSLNEPLKGSKSIATTKQRSTKIHEDIDSLEQKSTNDRKG